MRQRLVEGADGVSKAHGDGGLPEEQTGFGVADSGCLDAPVTGHRFDEQAVDAIDLGLQEGVASLEIGSCGLRSFLRSPANTAV